ncbi:hypothetical protein, partial [Gardnerella vaginalis]|uniref:hypothetical protein n=1 Tax=Gardnerella vaginalis TaxID=2702 RepID=UPI001E586A34
SRFLKNFPRLFSGNYSSKNTNTIKPLKNQHSTHITHATRRHHAAPHQRQTNTTRNATLQYNRSQLDSRICSLFSKIETNAGKKKQKAGAAINNRKLLLI